MAYEKMHIVEVKDECIAEQGISNSFRYTSHSHKENLN